MNFSVIALNLTVVLISFILADKRRCCLCTTFNEVKYSFRYAVEAAQVGVITQHWEERRGDYVRGMYSLVEPDGRIRVVEYQVDGPRGFTAIVKHRRFSGRPIMGHLQFPRQYRDPIWHVQPVSVITSDILQGKRTYPNLPD